MAYFGLVLFKKAFFIAILIAIKKPVYMLKHKFYLRTTRCNSSGESALYFLINTKPQAWIASGVFIHSCDWEQRKQLLLVSCPDYYRVSSKINELKAKADIFMMRLQQEKKQFVVSDFTKAVITGDCDQVFNPLLRELISEYLDVNKLSIGRHRHYEVFSREIHELRPGTRIKEVDHLFAVAYEKYCLRKGNSRNTIATKMKRLKAVVHFAQNKKIISADPLASYRITMHRSSRIALTRAELAQLQELAAMPGELNNIYMPVLHCFLFMCYTGLRYGDMKTLMQGDIKNCYIRIDMHKTGLPVSIPVLPAAMELLDVQPDGHCFRVLANEPFNRYLKEIAKAAGIKKRLSTRVARHTFATVSIGLGMSMKVISEILGHTTIKTTEIYTSVFDEMKSDEMKRWLSVAYKSESMSDSATA